MKKVFIPMQPDNVRAIQAGAKTTTVRSEAMSKAIGLAAGETGEASFGGMRCKVTLRGAMTVEEAGGKEAMLRSEGYISDLEVKYQQTRDWLNGGRNLLYVYDIVPIKTR